LFFFVEHNNTTKGREFLTTRQRNPPSINNCVSIRRHLQISPCCLLKAAFRHCLLLLSSRDVNNGGNWQLGPQDTSIVDKNDNGGSAHFVRDEQRGRTANPLIGGSGSNGRHQHPPPLFSLLLSSSSVILVVVCISVFVGIVVLLLMILLRALAAIDTTIALASVVTAAIVVAAAATTAKLPTTLLSAQPLQLPLSLHLLQPSLPSSPLPPLSTLSLLSPLLPPPPPLPRSRPCIHCHHCCSLHQRHHVSNAPVDGWLLY
jgi:hypothetical protein